jgi:hypothetical protein
VKKTNLQLPFPDLDLQEVKIAVTYGTGLEPRHLLYLSENKERRHAEVEFLDILGTKVFPLFHSLSPLLTNVTPPPPLEQKRFETGL